MRPMVNKLGMFLVATLLALTFEGAAAPRNPSPLDLNILLPNAPGVAATWVLPPTSAKEAAKIEESSLRFGVDDQGHPWLGGERRVLSSPLERASFAVESDYDDFAWVPKGGLILASSGVLGFLTEPVGNASAGVFPVYGFKPVVKVPGTRQRLFPAVNGVFVVATAEDQKTIAVYLLRRKGGLEFLARVEGFVAAVAGGDKTAYLAVGKTILKVSGKDTAVVLKLKTEVTDLAFSPDAGLFYATAAGVGFVKGHRGVRFLSAEKPRIRTVGRCLYVLMTATLGVVRIDGIEAFNKAG